MNVIMNGEGKFARVIESHTHIGYTQHLEWVNLNSATMFPNNVSKRDYKNVYNELSTGIAVAATETRVITLVKVRE